MFIFYIISQKSDTFAKRYFNVEQSRFVFNPILEIKRIGYIPYFVMNSSKSLMEKPYNKRDIEEITNDYEKQSIQYNKAMANDIKNEHTIIYLSESFWQDKNVLNDKLPAPFINSLERKNGGKLISSYVGGGTANIEFEILTSMSLNLHNNPQTTSPYLDYFNKSNNHSSALNMVKKNTVIHPYTFGLYNRLQVYEDMEIKDLYDQNDMNNIKFLPGSGRASDETLHQFLIPKIKDYNMINLISMQNHSPYKYGVLKNNGYVPNILSGVFSVGESNNQYDDNINRAISYFKQIHETDRAIQSLLKHIDEERENINIIFYGDHAPSILNNKERLIGQVIYRTPFFIYQNNDRDNMKASSELSPIFIYPKLLSEGKYKVSPYYYLMIKLYDSGVQDIYSDKVLINGKSIKIEDIDVDIKRLVEDYKSINYYRYFTKQSINREFFEKYSK
jgi:phosphoglycerol transferase MdoB-like AlkP superfamily enzyme